ncbi:MAG: efflux RND transporter periplasmic adaptor subunit [Armatimonadota bacterium]|nr:efflux RND transporter periplasmic adaptor subunit [Armatimonadota bacterium]MDR7426688.1 efflux RND transporter periplasmic adaptor subunit [Armatimonadota bacterium]MDR7465072.1 efflux RND transporter periplasmic adaptor subunit [Armatimonadota bacterium]MDR7469239.1 efflux RND transporter periplasmic adaptor subunit [Armatimonadota bacterium]MDR7475050.1 efflux RND transporter periplasmic adaptor subunit [Armatimonadota bacterium]
MRRVVGILLAAGLLALAGWRAVEVIRARQVQAVNNATPRARTTVVQAVPAARGTITMRAVYVGEVAARARVEVFSRIGGVVAEVAVREGDLVRRGQVVVRLDPKELRFQVEQALAAVRTQRLQVEQARVTLATQEARLAQLLAGAPPEQIRQAEEQVRQAGASLEYSRQQLGRAQELYAQGFVAGQAVEAARLEVVLQETRLRSAEEQLRMLRGGPRPEEVEVARRQVRQAEVALRQAQSQLAQGEVALHQAESLLGESTVRAPATGVVSRRMVDPGATVTPATSLLQLVDVDPVLVTIPVAERETAFIRPGMRAAARIDALPGRIFSGLVVSISPVLATSTRTAEVRIEVPNPGRLLRPGMTARVELELVARTDVVTVPVDAVLEQEGVKRLFVVAEGVARARQVQTGISDGVRVEVSRGLAAGELVVVAGQHTLRDGAPVLVAESGRKRP